MKLTFENARIDVRSRGLELNLQHEIKIKHTPATRTQY